MYNVMCVRERKEEGEREGEKDLLHKIQNAPGGGGGRGHTVQNIWQNVSNHGPTIKNGQEDDFRDRLRYIPAYQSDQVHCKKEFVHW